MRLAAQVLFCALCVLYGVLVLVFVSEDTPKFEKDESILSDISAYEKEPQEYDESKNRDLEFKKKTSTKVLLYTYMRGGSSFLGELFRMNKEAVYWFEAIDGFYQDTFMTLPHNKPLNLLYYTNGTKRVVTSDESKAVAEFHKNLFSCNYRDVQMSFFKDFQHRRSSKQFGRCGINPATCRNMLRKVCRGDKHGNRNSLSDNIEYSINNSCFEKLQKVKLHKLQSGIDKTIEPIFYEYFKCQNKVRQSFIQICEEQSLAWCGNARIHAAKEVRLTMELVEETMKTVPDLFLVYSARDPRAIISSRYTPGKKGLLTFDVKREAELLCHRMFSDLNILNDLRQKFPGRIMEITFENLVTEPFKKSKELYQFIQEPIPKEVIDWLNFSTGNNDEIVKRNAKGKFSTYRANSSAVVNAWRTRLEPQLIKHITKTCKDVLVNLNYDL